MGVAAPIKQDTEIKILYTSHISQNTIYSSFDGFSTTLKCKNHSKLKGHIKIDGGSNLAQWMVVICQSLFYFSAYFPRLTAD